jgi:hypothetical protein
MTLSPKDMTPVYKATIAKGTNAARWQPAAYVDHLPPCNSACGVRAMTTEEIPVATTAARAVERMIAGDALARLPELFGMHEAYQSRQAFVGFSYIANRLLRLAALPGDSR